MLFFFVILISSFQMPNYFADSFQQRRVLNLLKMMLCCKDKDNCISKPKKQLELIVKCYKREIVLSVEDDVTIREVKVYVCMKIKTNVSRVSLMYNGTILQDEKSLAEYPIENKAVINAEVLKEGKAKTCTDYDFNFKSIRSLWNDCDGVSKIKKNFISRKDKPVTMDEFFRDPKRVIKYFESIPMYSVKLKTNTIFHDYVYKRQDLLRDLFTTSNYMNFELPNIEVMKKKMEETNKNSSERRIKEANEEIDKNIWDDVKDGSELKDKPRGDIYEDKSAKEYYNMLNTEQKKNINEIMERVGHDTVYKSFLQINETKSDNVVPITNIRVHKKAVRRLNKTQTVDQQFELFKQMYKSLEDEEYRIPNKENKSICNSNDFTSWNSAMNLSSRLMKMWKLLPNRDLFNKLNQNMIFKDTVIHGPRRLYVMKCLAENPSKISKILSTSPLLKRNPYVREKILKEVPRNLQSINDPAFEKFINNPYVLNTLLFGFEYCEKEESEESCNIFIPVETSEEMKMFELVYNDQLEILETINFVNRKANLRALISSSGHIEKAKEILLGIDKLGF